MFASLKEDIKYTMKFGNMINKVIIVNACVWLILLLLKIVLNTTGGGNSAIYQGILELLMIGKEPLHDLIHPWVWITHMFTHERFFHLLWNMLFLFWFGKITGDLIGDRRMLPLYLLGGIAGAIVFFLSANAFPSIVGSYALGASAAVTGIVFVGATLSPDYIVRLFLIGNVQIKWIALAMIIFDLIGLANMDNSGGHLAHLGGAAFGYLYAVRLRQGVDMTQPIIQWWDGLNSLFKAKQRRSNSNLHVRFKNEDQHGSKQPPSKPYQEKLDEILDKIKQSGYENLNEEEKEFLFQASKKP
jgi:membrane associated rhomboid family serine protease